METRKRFMQTTMLHIEIVIPVSYRFTKQFPEKVESSSTFHETVSQFKLEN